MSDEQPAGQLRFRAAELVGVSFPQRTVELIVIPYETETLVPHPYEPGRMITEIISRGAFNGVERRPNRIKVNRDHDVRRTVGKALTLHPSRDEGLVGRVKISRTELGDETLQLAEDGILDASAAFLPSAGGEKWETRNRCRMTKCWLGHIALVPDPAYDNARVLAVRQAQRPDVLPLPGEKTPTPNLDLVRAWRLEDRYAQLDNS